MNEIDVVVDVRQNSDTSELIVVKQKLVTTGDLHPQGSPIETKLGWRNRKVQLTAFSLASGGQELTLGVRITASNPVLPLEIDLVALETELRPPLDFPVFGFVSEFGPGYGRGLLLVPRSPEKRGSLQPGESREWLLPPPMMETAALLGASISPGKFWIAAYSGREEVGRLAGTYLGSFLPDIEKLRISIHRRAQPAFDTLPEMDRLAVLLSVASLRDVECEHWPPQRVQKLPNQPGEFVVRVTHELAVLVTRPDQQGIEIKDIVLKGVLEQF